MTQHVWKFGGWWGEGDEKFFVDGERTPSTAGTGSEDYIGHAWAAEPVTLAPPPPEPGVIEGRQSRP